MVRGVVRGRHNDRPSTGNGTNDNYKEDKAENYERPDKWIVRTMAGTCSQLRN
jgi:hypothetical protein